MININLLTWLGIFEPRNSVFTGSAIYLKQYFKHIVLNYSLKVLLHSSHLAKKYIMTEYTEFILCTYKSLVLKAQRTGFM
jgi:hypothetical protein